MRRLREDLPIVFVEDTNSSGGFELGFGHLARANLENFPNSFQGLLVGEIPPRDGFGMFMSVAAHHNKRILAHTVLGSGCGCTGVRT